MRIAVVTLFPALFEIYRNEGLFAKAEQSGLVRLTAIDIRDFTTDKHRTADDILFGGGAGMVMKPEPVVRAVESLGEVFAKSDVIVASARGALFNQEMAERLSSLDTMTIVCGRYKGIDARVVEILGATEISVGDYVLGAGEIAALAIIDAVVRLIPGFLGDLDSAESDSHSGADRLLSAPEFTRPREFRGHSVPEILLTGNHSAIENWRRRISLQLTAERRPDLLRKAKLTPEEMAYIESILNEQGNDKNK